jgi:protein-S-isoprenylcysteine O-methyltransferase Ste14
MLGQFFTGNVRIQQGQRVIQQGPYRLVRHPSYTGGMLVHLGCGLALANWMAALALFVTTGLGYLYRVHVEEKALVAGLGAEYRAYMQRTKRFVPYVI